MYPFLFSYQVCCSVGDLLLAMSAVFASSRPALLGQLLAFHASSRAPLKIDCVRLIELTEIRLHLVIAPFGLRLHALDSMRYLILQQIVFLRILLHFK